MGGWSFVELNIEWVFGWIGVKYGCLCYVGCVVVVLFVMGLVLCYKVEQQVFVDEVIIVGV